MHIKEEQHKDYISLYPIGDLDANSSIIMDEKIRALIEQGCINIHINCEMLEYISSAGLGVFISFIDEVRAAGGDIVFSSMSNKIYRVFELLGLHAIMKILPQGKDVIAVFRS